MDPNERKSRTRANGRNTGALAGVFSGGMPRPILFILCFGFVIWYVTNHYRNTQEGADT